VPGNPACSCLSFSTDNPDRFSQFPGRLFQEFSEDKKFYEILLSNAGIVEEDGNVHAGSVAGKNSIHRREDDN